MYPHLLFSVFIPPRFPHQSDMASLYVDLLELHLLRMTPAIQPEFFFKYSFANFLWRRHVAFSFSVYINILWLCPHICRYHCFLVPYPPPPLHNPFSPSSPYRCMLNCCNNKHITAPRRYLTAFSFTAYGDLKRAESYNLYGRSCFKVSKSKTSQLNNITR